MSISERDLWAGTSGPRDAAIAFVGESWGEEEARQRIPLVGQSGQLFTTICNDAGIDRNACFITNVCSRHPPGNKMELFFIPTVEARASKQESIRGLYPTQETLRDIQRLYQQLAMVRPKVIIAMGNWAMWALCSGLNKIGDSKDPSGYKIPTGIVAWRGSQLGWDTAVYGVNEGLNHPIPVIPVIHPAAAQRQWSFRPSIVHDLRVRALPISHGIIQEPNYDFTIRPSFDRVCQWIKDELQRGVRRWSVDIETRGGHIACICLATSATRAISIPLMCVEREQGYFTLTEERIIYGLLSSLLTSDRLEIVGQNFIYDRQYLSKFLFIHPRMHFDTMLAHHLCWPGTPRGLSYLASLYCRYYRYWKDEGKDWEPGVAEDQLWRYNCIDGVTTWEISYELEKLIAKLGLTEQWAEQLEFAQLAYEMMDSGVAIDKQSRAAMTLEVMAEMTELERQFVAIMPENIVPLITGKNPKTAKPWYRSPTQQAKFFYDLMAIDPVYKRDTGQRTADDDALMKIKVREPILAGLCDRLQDYRSLGVFHKNFLTAPLDPDGRMRCSFDPSGTSTFRWSSSTNAFGRGCNLQTIPKGDTE